MSEVVHLGEEFVRTERKYLPNGTLDTIHYYKKVEFPHEPRHSHTYIAARPKTGKSELIKILAHHEMRQKRAVVVVDAHSDLCEEIAGWEQFHSAIVYVRGAGFIADYSAVINPLQLPRGANDHTKELMAEKLAEVIAEITPGEGAERITTRMLNVLKPVVRVLLDEEAPTLIDVRDMLRKASPKALIEKGKNHPIKQIREFFLHEWDSGAYESSKDALNARLTRLLQMEEFTRMTCGVSTVPFYDLVNEGKILLFSLGGMAGTAGTAIGKLILAMTTIVGDFRKTVAKEARRQVHFFVDECQNFAGPSVVEILTELRKYGICLTLANQFPSQFSSDVENAVLSTPSVFLLGIADYPKSFLRRVGLSIDDIQGLKAREFYAVWGDQPPVKFTAHDQVANQHRAMLKSTKIAFQLRQKKFYRAITPDAPALTKGTVSGRKEITIGLE